MTTIASCPQPRFSGRELLDLATIVTAGVASTVFFLIPIWTPHDRGTAARPAAPQIVATPPAVVATIAPPPAPTARPRSAPRAARPTKRTPEFVQVKAESHPHQSKITRFLLGDGSEAVRPFPLARQRRER